MFEVQQDIAKQIKLWVASHVCPGCKLAKRQEFVVCDGCLRRLSRTARQQMLQDFFKGRFTAVYQRVIDVGDLPDFRTIPRDVE